jgi:hypothetical protein
VSSRNGNGIPSETVTGAARNASARCLSRALICAFDVCDETGVPLSQLQRIAILEAVLCEFDGFGENLSSLATVSWLLRELGPLGSPHAA